MNNTKSYRWTAFVVWGDYDMTEEVDVDAPTQDEAATLVATELDMNYEPGGTIVRIERRFGFYL